MGEIYSELKQALHSQQMVSLATVLAGPWTGRKLLIWPDGRMVGTLGNTALNAQVRGVALGAMRAQQTERHTFNVETEAVDVFVEVFPPLPRLIMIGAVHIAMSLATFAKELGFRTIVVDAREAFASPERFPQVDELIVRWPAEALKTLNLDEASYVVCLSHDEKLDNPALQVALNSPVRYIGALGSPKTHARRVKALKEMGVSDAQLARIHAPVGLNLRAKGPQEIALSIIAEIIAVKRGSALAVST